MPTIQRDDGATVSWGGTVEGPQLVYDPNTGGPTTFVRYSAKIGVGEPELREFYVYVTALGENELERRGAPKDAVRRCVVKYIEERCKRSWVPQNNEHFTIHAEELLQIYLEL